jgi:hypothetical protein
MSSRSFWRNEADKIRNDRSAVDTSVLFANPWEEEGAAGECCARAIKNWNEKIRQKLFDMFLTTDQSRFTSKNDIDSFLKPKAIELQSIYQNESWYSFCKKPTKSRSTGNAMTPETYIQLFGASTLLDKSINETFTGVSKVFSFNFDSASYLIPSEQAIGACDSKNKGQAIFLGLKYEFKAKLDQDTFQFVSDEGDITPKILLPLQQPASSEAEGDKSGWLPYAVLKDRTNVRLVVYPSGSSPSTSIYTVKVERIILDPWPFSK